MQSFSKVLLEGRMGESGGKETVGRSRKEGRGGRRREEEGEGRRGNDRDGGNAGKDGGRGILQLLMYIYVSTRTSPLCRSPHSTLLRPTRDRGRMGEEENDCVGK